MTLLALCSKGYKISLFHGERKTLFEKVEFQGFGLYSWNNYKLQYEYDPKAFNPTFSRIFIEA